MLQSNCLLRIGVTNVYGCWLPGWAGGAHAEAMARFETETAQPGTGLGDAVAAVLDKILPSRRLMSPHLCVGLAGYHFRSAIITFQKLPKAAEDRNLVVSQRFSREFRLDAAAFTILGSILGPAKGGGEAVLCAAVPNSLLTQIKSALGAKRLYADVIAPDYMLSFAEADTRELEAPGIALMQGFDGSVILVWNKDKTIVHAASFASGEDDEGAGRRTAARIYRYAKICGGEGASVAVYTGGRVPDALASAEAFPGHSIRLLRWPAGQGVWGQQMMGVGL